KRMQDGKPSLYTMTDPISISEKQSESVGLAEKHPDVKKMDVQFPGKTFSDILGHPEQAAIESLSVSGIINGKTEDSFEPQSTMTRAEFATIIARGLGLPIQNTCVFFDVAETDWFYSYVNTAYAYGIIKGVSESEFYPNGTITREEAAVMVARAASLCGMDTEIELYETRNVLSQFSDYVTAAAWSQSSLAFCYREGILPDDAMEIHPGETVTRAEIAMMLSQMLSFAKLL
ncbi:MAG: S-layer homology domain-containing protein, partial [Clostridia bacterium]|nr:S-layer homology domain-containing protein [Clostridia bacterium]